MERYILFPTIIFYLLINSGCDHFEYKPDYKPEDTIIQFGADVCDNVVYNKDYNGGSGGKYTVGDFISEEDQSKEFPYCYPESLESSFSFSNHQNKIIMIEMAATW